MSPDDTATAALLGLPRMTPRRARLLLDHHEPCAAWSVLRGEQRGAPLVTRLLGADGLGDAWRHAATPDRLADAARQGAELGIAVHRRGRPGYPASLIDDRAAPAALFVRGDLGRLGERRVAIVGTRNASRRGRELAAELGGELAAAGVTVVSGLAKGVDGAAHRGALEAGGAPPLAIIGNGPDRAYPRQHAPLFDRIVERGAVVSEWPAGVTPDGYRFPLRNRLVAAMSEVVVVVESRVTGGSMSTVREALARDVTVLAVPGTPGRPGAAGTNALLADGAGPVTCAADVLVALGLDGRRRGEARFDPRPRPDGPDRAVLELCRSRPARLDDVVRLVGDLRGAALSLARLERDGWVCEADGWFEAVGVPVAGS